MLCEIYGFIHKTAKRLLKQNNSILDQYEMVSFSDGAFQDGILDIPKSYKGPVNELECQGQEISQCEVYPVENLVSKNSGFGTPTFKVQKDNASIKCNSAYEAWLRFVSASRMPDGYKYAGCHYAGFIKKCNQWCLPSWIWTNGAVIRMLCTIGKIPEAEKLAECLLKVQQPCGGWIVRNDYGRDGIAPELAPNDSAYLANNGFVELYLATGKDCYLQSAEKCAEWIIETARDDGLVLFGYNLKTNEWIKDRNIVDTGFTAGLFARLYQITKKDLYRSFLERFVKKYIDVFYMPEQKCFATAVDGNDRQKGGAFGRGQAWALEGLIPAYEVLRTKEIEKVIQDTVSTLLERQDKDGGWSYNLMKPLMGQDCKAVSVIARSLMEWNKIDGDRRLVEASKNALKWCKSHTSLMGNSTGGIFSYTIEGAIVHHMYTETAMVYASAYAVEVSEMLKEH